MVLGIGSLRGLKLRSIKLVEAMVPMAKTYTFLTKIEFWALNTLVPDACYWVFPALHTLDSIMPAHCSSKKDYYRGPEPKISKIQKSRVSKNSLQQ